MPNPTEFLSDGVSIPYSLLKNTLSAIDTPRPQFAQIDPRTYTVQIFVKTLTGKTMRTWREPSDDPSEESDDVSSVSSYTSDFHIDRVYFCTECGGDTVPGYWLCNLCEPHLMSEDDHDIVLPTDGMPSFIMSSCFAAILCLAAAILFGFARCFVDAAVAE